MHESVFIAAMLILLAVSGVQPGQAQSAKFCHPGLAVAVLPGC